MTVFSEFNIDTAEYISFDGNLVFTGREVGDDVDGITFELVNGPVHDVGTCTQSDGVAAGANTNQIIASTCVDPVVASAAADEVATFRSTELVGACTTIDVVGEVTSESAFFDRAACCVSNRAFFSFGAQINASACSNSTIEISDDSAFKIFSNLEG